MLKIKKLVTCKLLPSNILTAFWNNSILKRVKGKANAFSDTDKFSVLNFRFSKTNPSFTWIKIKIKIKDAINLRIKEISFLSSYKPSRRKRKKINRKK